MTTCKVIICIPDETQRLLRLWTKPIMPYRFLPVDGQLSIAVAEVEIDPSNVKQMIRLSRVVKGVARTTTHTVLKFQKYALVRTDQAQQSFAALYSKPETFDAWVTEAEQDLVSAGAKLVVDQDKRGKRREKNAAHALVIPLFTAIEAKTHLPESFSFREAPDIAVAPRFIGLAGPGARAVQKYL